MDVLQPTITACFLAFRKQGMAPGCHGRLRLKAICSCGDMQPRHN
jgi:hypothetical protein